MPASELSAVILAGGRGARLPGKCYGRLGDKELILHVLDRVSQATQEIVVSVKSKEQAVCVAQLRPSVQVVLDDSQSQSPLIGFLLGLRVVKGMYVFAAPCDTAFIEPGVIKLLLQRAIGNDGAIPLNEDNFLELLCAVYRRKSAQLAAEESIEEGDLSMHAMVARLPMFVRVPMEDNQTVDPNLLSLRNINTELDLVLASDLVHRKKETSKVLESYRKD